MTRKWAASLVPLRRVLPAAARPAAAPAFRLVAAMWGAMVLAMMLPTPAPMILTYAETPTPRRKKAERVVSPFVLAAGYGAVWLGFAAGRDGRANALHTRRLARRRHGLGQRLLLRRDLHRRRRSTSSPRSSRPA